MYIRNNLLGSVSYRCFSPDVETGAEQQQETTLPPLNERQVDGPGSGRSDIRKSLEKGFDDSRKTDKDRDDRGKFVAKDGKRPAINNQGEEPGGQEPDAGEQRDGQQEADGAEQVDAGTVTATPPEAWSKEAKAEWAKIPPIVQAAISKREADGTKGVDELKKRYSALDQVLKPREEILKRTGHEPAAAVNQLFSWFEALNMDSSRVKNGQAPVAFVALAQSFGLDPYKLFGGQQQADPVKQADPAKQSNGKDQQEPPLGEVPEPLQRYITGLEAKLQQLEAGFTQKIGGLESTFAERSYAETNNILTNWAKDKPHYEEVRGMMAHLIGSGAVQPQANGAADLDRAYDMALYALPDVRAKVLAEAKAKEAAELKAKQAQERKAQQDQADKARRANVGLSSSAPGGSDSQQQKPKKGKTVRESIQQAREELSE